MTSEQMRKLAQLQAGPEGSPTKCDGCGVMWNSGLRPTTDGKTRCLECYSDPKMTTDAQRGQPMHRPQHSRPVQYPPKTRIISRHEFDEQRGGYIPDQLIEVLPNGDCVVGEQENEAVKRLEEQAAGSQRQTGIAEDWADAVRITNQRMEHDLAKVRNAIGEIEFNRIVGKRL